MPIQTTLNPNRLRVSFSFDEKVEGVSRQTEIVSFLQLTSSGIEIEYDHHLVRVRTAPLSPPLEEFKHRLTINPTLQAVIVAGVQREWWNHFATTFRIGTGELG